LACRNGCVRFCCCAFYRLCLARPGRGSVRRASRGQLQCLVGCVAAGLRGARCSGVRPCGTALCRPIAFGTTLKNFRTNAWWGLVPFWQNSSQLGLVHLRGRSGHGGGHGPGVGCVPGRGALRSGGRRGSIRGSNGARICCSALMLVSVCMRFSFTLCGAQAFCRGFSLFQALSFY
jgi:hypothetical protein